MIVNNKLKRLFYLAAFVLAMVMTAATSNAFINNDLSKPLFVTCAIVLSAMLTVSLVGVIRATVDISYGHTHSEMFDIFQENF